MGLRRPGSGRRPAAKAGCLGEHMNRGGTPLRCPRSLWSSQVAAQKRVPHRSFGAVRNDIVKQIEVLLAWR